MEFRPLTNIRYKKNIVDILYMHNIANIPISARGFLAEVGIRTSDAQQPLAREEPRA